MPGVNVTTATRSGPAATTTAPGSRYFVAGLTSQGPLTPTVVRGMTDYIAQFGPRVSYGAVYDDLRVFFEEGGMEAVVCRTVGPTPTAALVSINDRAGTPQPTLKVTAANPGQWGASLTAAVTASATSGAFDLTISLSGTQVEQFTALVTPADAVNALLLSSYVRGTDLGSATVAPNNQPVVGSFPLTGGLDDRANVTVAQYAAALDQAGEAFGPGAVACPGQPVSTIGATLLAHAVKYGRVALLAVAPGSTLAQAKTAVTTFRTANTSNLEYAGLFWPSVTFTDNGRVPRTVTPEGFVAASRARAILTQGGPWQAPAGAGSVARFVTGVDVTADQVAGNDANTNGVSAIRVIGSGGPRLYGWRSLSLDVNNYFELKDRDVLNILTALAKAAMEPYAFQTIDAGGQLLGRMRVDLLGICQALVQAGALYPQLAADNSVIDPGYSVDVGPAINSQSIVLANQVAAALAVRLAPSAETVQLSIIKAAVGSSVTV